MIHSPFHFMVGTQGYPIWHKCSVQPDGSFIMSGCDPGQLIMKGSAINGAGLVEEATEHGPKVFLAKAEWKVAEVLERRDHRGKFNNPKDAVNSFFKVRIEVAQ